jgi:hypothetical protein
LQELMGGEKFEAALWHLFVFFVVKFITELLYAYVMFWSSGVRLRVSLEVEPGWSPLA